MKRLFCVFILIFSCVFGAFCQLQATGSAGTPADNGIEELYEFENDNVAIEFLYNKNSKELNEICSLKYIVVTYEEENSGDYKTYACFVKNKNDGYTLIKTLLDYGCETTGFKKYFDYYDYKYKILKTETEPCDKKFLQTVYIKEK